MEEGIEKRFWSGVACAYLSPHLQPRWARYLASLDRIFDLRPSPFTVADPAVGGRGGVGVR